MVTATALHWLDTEPLRRLYGELAGVLRAGGGALDWADWWHMAAGDPLLAEATARRFALLGDPRGPKPDGGARRDRPTATRWHIETLLGHGFSEARQVWCSASDALVAALR